MKNVLSAIAVTAFLALTLPAADIHVNCASTATTEDGSQAAPYKTIYAGVRKAKNGDTVIVSGGTYRENLFIRNKKGDEKLLIRAAEGQRPVISGFDIVTDWTRGEDGLYRCKLAFEPRHLLVNDTYMPMARLPELGWSVMTLSKDKSKFTAPITDKIEPGTDCFIWYSGGNYFGTLAIKSSPKPGEFEFVPHKNRIRPVEKFYFRNHPCLIRKSGQWAYTKLGKNSYELAIKWDGDIKQTKVEVCGGRQSFQIRYANNLEISGFDCIGFRTAGIQISGCKNVVLSKLGLFWNGRGAYIRGNENVELYDCRVSGNHGGISGMSNTNITIRKCDVGYNAEDGITITWKAKGALVEACRVHHHLWRGHPDNIQFYRDVDGVTLKDNLFFCGGQGLMAEQIKNFTLENNAFIGSDAVQVIWGHGSSDNITMNRNTVILGGWGGMAVTGSGNTYRNNVIQGINFHGHQKDRKYIGENNVFIKSSKRWSNSVDKKFPWTFEEYIKLSGESNSQMQLLPVEGMPNKMGIVDNKEIVNCTTDTLFLRRKGGKNFQVGDTVEIRFDGVPRTVTKATEDAITITPALKYPPAHTYFILNWGKNKDMKWAPKFVGEAGAKVNLDDIRLDRCTSVPMPKQVQYYIDHIDRLLK